MGLAETKEAIAAASKAFKTWSKTTAKERHDLLVKFYNLMRANDDDLARLIVRAFSLGMRVWSSYTVLQTVENGKPLAEGMVRFQSLHGFPAFSSN